eukprot:gene1630-2857_t
MPPTKRKRGGTGGMPARALRALENATALLHADIVPPLADDDDPGIENYPPPASY